MPLGEQDFRGKSKGGGKGKERGKSRGGEKRLYAKDASCYNSIRLCLRSVQTTCVSNQRARDVMRRGALSYSMLNRANLVGFWRVFVRRRTGLGLFC